MCVCVCVCVCVTYKCDRGPIMQSCGPRVRDLCLKEKRDFVSMKFTTY